MSKDFIKVYKNRVSKRLCEDAIKLFNKREELGFVKKRSDFDPARKIDKDDHMLTVGEKLSDPFDHYTDMVLSLESSINDCIEEYYDEFGILTANFPETQQCRALQIQRTSPGEGYHQWHFERNKVYAHRILAWTVYLNDDFEAGETEFLYQAKRIKPEAGSVCVFPADWTHTHRGNQPIDGDKYIITGWILED